MNYQLNYLYVSKKAILKNKILAIGFLMLCAFIPLNAQNAKTDSLENLLSQHVLRDTLRVNLLNEIAGNYYSINLNKMLLLAKEAGELSDTLNFATGKAKSLVVTSSYYLRKLDYPKTLELLQKSIKIYQELGKEYELSNSFIKIGVAYKYKGDYLKTIEYFNKSLKLNKKFGDKIMISKLYNNIGIVYRNLGNYPKALENYHSALKINEKLDNKQEMANCYTNIGVLFGIQEDYPKALAYFQNSLKIQEDIGGEIGLASLYINLGNVSRNQGDYSNALDYYQKSLKLKKKSGKKLRFSSGYINIGITYFIQDNYSKALENFQRALNTSIQLGDKPNETWANLELSKLYLKQHKTREALNYSKKAFKIAEEMGGLELIKESSKVLSKSYETLGLFKEAYKYHVIFKTMNDSLYNEKNIKKISSLEYQYQYDKEKQTIELEQQKKDAVTAMELKRQKLFRNIFITGSVFLLVLIFVVIRFSLYARKLAASALKQEQENTKLRSHFLENISHEIRTPITLVQGNINLIKKHKNSPKEIEIYAEKALLQSSKAIKDANDVLQLLKVEKAKLTLKSTKRPLNIFMNDTFFAFKYRATQEYQSLRYLTNINNDLEVSLDYEKIERIITNLISNALKYSPQYTEVTVQCLVNKRSLSIIVKDKGIGIAVDEQQQIFTKFYQTTNNQTTGGLGIGLSLVKELVLFLNGTITVDSELEKGTCFTVKIPINIADDLSLYLEKKETLFTPIEEEITIQKQDIVGYKHVLIVDDNKELVNYLQEILTPHFNCDSAYNGKEALNKVTDKEYDLILSDLMMPEMDGFEFKKELNKIQGYESIPFLMLTANVLIETKIESFTIGINDYITKPFNERELIVRIKNLLKNKQLQNETIQLFDESDILIDDSKSFDKQFLDNVTQIVQDNLDNETFKVSDLAFECSYSRRQLTRIIKKITGLSPAKFILELRLLKAYELIINKTYPNLNEVMYTVGISTYHSFNTTFYSRFGIKPNELLKMKKLTG